MPKKRFATTSSKPSQPRAGPDYTWIPDVQTFTSSSQLKQEHLERAIGLTNSRACTNRLALEVAERNRVDEVEDEDDDIEDDKSEKDDEDPIALSGPIIVDLDGEDPVSTFPRPTTLDDSRKRTLPRPKQKVYGKAQNQNKNKKSKNNKTSFIDGKGGDMGGTCTAAGCRENLTCLNHMGAKVWLDPKSKQKFLDLQGLGPDPALEARDPLLPVGLRNLGATCYANAFLQVWYRILPFRSAVYACAMDPAMFPTSPCYQLALTFTGLQNSLKGVFDPSGLVDALKLEKGDQQDASEFSKLFMALLQTEFSKNDDPKVKSVINDQFEGQLKYKTECLTCGYISKRPENFLELEISMEGTESSLTNRLALSLAPEMLDGDNRYFCTSCDTLRDAKRSHQIETVPPTLNFSLLRFVFDPKTYERRKSKTTIAFPPRINLRPYMSDKVGKDLWYELRGVIEHKGPSAHHGHFVARVYDSESKQWVLCDDETTTKIRAMTASPTEPDVELEKEVSDDDMIVLGNTEDESRRNDRSDSSMNGKTSSKPNSRGSRSQSGEKTLSDIRSRQKSKAADTPVKLHKSQQAYMIVYGLAQDDTLSTSIPVPATKTNDQIVAENSAWEADGQAYEMRRDDLLRRYEHVKKSKLDIMCSWSLDNDIEEDGRFVSLVSLKDWVVRGLEQGAVGKKISSHLRVGSPPENASEPMDVNTEEEKAPNEDVIVCDDNGNGVGASTGDSPHTNGGTPTLPPHTNEEVVPSGLDDRISTNVEVKLDRALDCIKHNGTSYNDPLAYNFMNRRLRCEHGNLSPFKTEDMRYISKHAYEQMLILGTSVDCQYQKADICRECVWLEVERQNADRIHEEAVSNYNSLKELEQVDVDQETYLVSSQWLRAWLRGDWTKTKQDYGQAWWDQCRSDIRCFHHAVKAKVDRKDCVTINEVAYEVIRNDDPDTVALPISLECQQCIEHEKGIRAVREAEIAQAARERKLVRPLIIPPDGLSIVLVNDTWNYIVPASFRTAWQEFVKDPIHKMRPCLTNEGFFCQHGRITIDFNFNPDLSVEHLISLLPSRWEALTRIYPIEPDQVIRVKPEKDKKLGTRNVPERQFCRPCWQLRSTGSHDSIRVRVRLTKEPMTTAPTATKNEADDQHDQTANNDHDDHETKETTKIQKGKQKYDSSELNSALLTPAVRKSSRLQSRPGQEKEVYIIIAKTSKIRHLKQEIDQAFNISPYAQRLYKDGVEIDDDKTSIQDSGMVFDGVIYVRDCSEDMFGDMDDVIVISDPMGERAAGGFQNTLLHGLAVETKSESPKETEVEVMAVEAFKKACNVCTYLNDIDLLACEICTAKF